MRLLIAAKDNNTRGDLFTELVTNLFQSLGYVDLLTNVPKTGREIDVSGTHSVSGHRLIAECKAYKAPIGGAHVNKFLGVLTHERTAHSADTIDGVFVSLSGFTSSVHAMQSEAPDNLLYRDQTYVAEQLVRSRLACSDNQVSLTTGRLIEQAGLSGLSLGDRDLVLCRAGLVWVQQLRSGGHPQYLTFVYSDGEPAAQPVVDQIVERLAPDYPLLAETPVLGPTLMDEQQSKDRERVLQNYFSYLLAQCGEIEMTGLSADADLTTRRYQLERLYVPLNVLVRSQHPDDQLTSPAAELQPPRSSSRPQNAPRPKRIPIGAALSLKSRLVLLGDPGSGKSTLVKRVAVAYADPSRRLSAKDKLPDRPWLPIFLRGRQLRGFRVRSINDILNLVPQVAELHDDSQTLVDIFRDALRSGRALFLIDGLDELPDAQERSSLCRQIEQVALQYPGSSFLITSRLVGYRELGFQIHPNFVHATVDEFRKEDITAYLRAWFRQVEHSESAATNAASRLLQEIMSNQRLARLAQNPLLLATIALIRRWVGELPKKRSTIYSEAVQVLLVNWNSEAHEPIRLEEALPQLQYVAFWMTQQGFQQIDQVQLLERLRAARLQMPDVLSYARLSPHEFVTAVEYRSSLLAEMGRSTIRGELMPVYEFRHLTFQEYLAAKAAVDRTVPDYSPTHTILDVLNPYLLNPSWREVVPLACVLAGRQANVLVTRILDILDQSLRNDRKAQHTSPDYPLQLAALCLSDEPNIFPDTANRFFALLASAAGHPTLVHDQPLEEALSRLADSLYATPMFEALANSLLRLRSSRRSISPAILLGTLAAQRLRAPTVSELREFAQSVFHTDDVQAHPAAAVTTALAVMDAAYSGWIGAHSRQAPFAREALRDWLTPLLDNPHPSVRLASAWALAWIFETSDVPCPPNLAHRLMEIALADSTTLLRRDGAWTLAAAFARGTLPPDLSWVVPPTRLHLRHLKRLMQSAIAGTGPDVTDPPAIFGPLAICALWAHSNLNGDTLDTLQPQLEQLGERVPKIRPILEALRTRIDPKPAFAATYR